MTTKKKVLITGGSGLIGGLVLKTLGHKYDFSAFNRRAIESVPCTQGDIADFDAVLPPFEGIDTVVHLSAYTEDVYEWEGTERVNIRGTYNVYEAARIHGVKRVIFASSGGTMLGYELESPYTEIAAAEYDKIPKVWPLLTHEMPVRPNSLCYVSKVFGEVLGRRRLVDAVKGDCPAGGYDPALPDLGQHMLEEADLSFRVLKYDGMPGPGPSAIIGYGREHPLSQPALGGQRSSGRQQTP